MSSEQPIAPWYKQPWLWFLLAPIFAVFCYGFFFLYLSIVTHDGIVKDDHYKIARGYTIDTTRLEHTQSLDLNGQLHIDMLTGELSLTLSGELTPLPQYVKLSIIHPAHQNYDQDLRLRQQSDSNRYLGNLQGTMIGKRYLGLTDKTKLWRLESRIQIVDSDKDTLIKTKLVPQYQP